VVFDAGARPLQLRRSVELRGGAPASAALANRRIRAVLSSLARSRGAADRGCEDLEDDDMVVRGGAVVPRRYLSGGGE
jgi:hypothetical protein